VRIAPGIRGVRPSFPLGTHARGLALPQRRFRSRRGLRPHGPNTRVPSCVAACLTLRAAGQCVEIGRWGVGRLRLGAWTRGADAGNCTETMAEEAGRHAHPVGVAWVVRPRAVQGALTSPAARLQATRLRQGAVRSNNTIPMLQSRTNTTRNDSLAPPQPRFAFRARDGGHTVLCFMEMREGWRRHPTGSVEPTLWRAERRVGDGAG
jgi:hypothetical protein